MADSPATWVPYGDSDFMKTESFVLEEADDNVTLAAFFRARRPECSWSQVRRLVETRHAAINGELCLDPARRLHKGETVELFDRPAAPLRQPDMVVVRFLDEHVVVAEKPAGMCSVRYHTERDWTERRKALSPTLEDVVPRLIAAEERRRGPNLPRLRAVHRIDKETSGLLVFARTVTAERELGRQFKEHTVTRRYLALVPGYVNGQTIRSRLVRDRGDGRRGSTSLANVGKEAITHVEVVERLPGHTLLGCRLETGRTHQIRIHLAELGHPICGEKVYVRPDLYPDPPAVEPPRLALHAAILGFAHPVSKEQMSWEMTLPDDLQEYLASLRQKKA